MSKIALSLKNREAILRIISTHYLSGEIISGDEIAGEVNLCRDSVYRHLRALAKDGKVYKKGKKYYPRIKLDVPPDEVLKLFKKIKRKKPYLYNVKPFKTEQVFERLIIIIGELILRGKNTIDLKCFIAEQNSEVREQNSGERRAKPVKKGSRKKAKDVDIMEAHQKELPE